MALFLCPQSTSWRRIEKISREEERLAYNKRIEMMRTTEYPMLKGITYLDHGGTTLASKSLMDSFCTQMKASIFSNPHSDVSRPSFSALMVEQTRQKVLKLFSANPEQFDVVFTANATGAIKLVMECFAGHEQGFDYLYHRNAHTSLVGVREQAQDSHCLETAEETEYWLEGGKIPRNQEPRNRPTLFAYPAQSNMNGERLPLNWPNRIRGSTRHKNTYILLDAAALVSTSPLDLSNHATAPDFVSMSFYKIFGFPDLGALIVRKASAHVLQRRKYFGGGTTEMIGCTGTPWVERKTISVHASLEDGTVAIRSILALNCAIDTHTNIFDGLTQVSKHTGWLAEILHSRLADLRHANRMPVCHMYKAPTSTYGDPKSQGATVTFNIKKSDGSWRSGFDVGVMLRANDVHVRTGSLCNPAGMASALGLSADELRAAFDSGFRCNQPGNDIRGDVPYGMIRATLGAMSTIGDVETLVRFIEKHLVEPTIQTPRTSGGIQAGRPEDSTIATIPFDEKSGKVTGRHRVGMLQERVRPGPRRRFWKVISNCFSRQE
ncbi:Molybdenum cofactor sulfurtransferase [Ascochyta rabiei]|uniref:Molybdenum cofactor sulfurtransferase n=1 Tax=Didymella rabiei TaxID=5454 RepID=UPI001900B151|nr:Molybdenum cofactor sulfurtransferase [Ascochyta rabiei]UPX18763.1 Molybdenum cofactor sulfurtransferase [Ascochyta rabiei]